MKKKNLLALLFALIFMFISVLPAFAEEGGLPIVPEEEAIQQAEEPVQPPEDEPIASDPAPDPDPGEDEDVPPVSDPDPSEDEDALPAPEDPQDPGVEEAPGENEGDASDTPEDPEDGDPSGEDEELPEDEENLDEEDPDEDTSEEEEEESDPEEEAPIINVSVPASGQVIINPYRMKVDTSTGEANDQIVHESQELINNSGFPLLVTARVTGYIQPESMSRFVFAPPADDAADKEIFMYVEFQNDKTFWTGSYSDWANQILVTEWGTEKENVMVLDAFGFGYFRLFGAMTNDPDAMWAAEDAPNVIIAFSFAEIPGAVETDAFPEAFSEIVPETSPENIPEASPEDIPEAPPEDILEAFPEDIAEAFPEEFPEVPPEAEDTEMLKDISDPIS